MANGPELAPARRCQARPPRQREPRAPVRAAKRASGPAAKAPTLAGDGPMPTPTGPTGRLALSRDAPMFPSSHAPRRRRGAKGEKQQGGMSKEGRHSSIGVPAPPCSDGDAPPAPPTAALSGQPSREASPAAPPRHGWPAHALALPSNASAGRETREGTGRAAWAESSPPAALIQPRR